MELNMQDKVVLLTGGTAGIGKVAAQKLAAQGASVIIAARNEPKAQETIRIIKAETSNRNIDYLIADLSSMQQVRDLAVEFRQRYNRLDVLLNNAGGFFIKTRQSADGIEMTWALNHLHYFMLTLLLVDLLVDSAPARVVNVSSNSHMGGRIDFEALRKNQMKGFYQGYSQTKLANIYFTYELARRLHATRVTANALHPGLVATDFGPRTGISRFFMQLLKPFSLTPEQGAQTLVYLASAPEVEGVTGKYFYQCEEIPSSRWSYDPQAARLLWDWSLKTAGFEQDPTERYFKDEPQPL
jgi:NAD(P)-dependent dehydrogenase (short-subunit alcohol dehydrogenase family)